MDSEFPLSAKKGIIDWFKSTAFYCVHCFSKSSSTLSILEFEFNEPEPYATGFFICPDCSSKFLVKIQDLGRVVAY
jgi:hypothetical protein